MKLNNFQTFVFYVAGVSSFLGCLCNWLFRHSVSLEKAGLLFIIPVAAIYTVIIVQTLRKNVRLLFNVTPDGVIEQYKQPWIVVASVCHYAVGDILSFYIICKVMMQLHVNEYLFIPLGALLFYFSPVGVFLSLLAMVYYLL